MVEEKAALQDKLTTLTSNYQTLINIASDPMLHKVLKWYTEDDKDYLIYAYNYRETDANTYRTIIRLINLADKHSAEADISIHDRKLNLINLDAEPMYKGCGKKLLLFIDRYAREHGITKIYGDVYEDTPMGLDDLIGFYDRRGYHIKRNERGVLIFEKEIRPSVDVPSE